MSKAELLFADNRCILCYYVLLIAFFILYSKVEDIHIRTVFCLSRKKNMQHVRKLSLYFIAGFTGLGMILYEILTFARGYTHITPVLAGFLLLGFTSVVFWLNATTVVKNVGAMVAGLMFLMCSPIAIVILIVAGGVHVDKYLGYVDVLMLLFALWQYKGFVDGWSKGDV